MAVYSGRMRSRLQTLLWSTLIVSGATVAPCAAQSRTPLPIGFVSLQRVLAEAADAKTAAQSLDTARQAKGQELNGQKQALEAAKLELANSGGFFKAARRQELQREVQQRENDLKKASPNLRLVFVHLMTGRDRLAVWPCSKEIVPRQCQSPPPPRELEAAWYNGHR